jgi:ligand-binding sensor domain-containing protein
VLRLRPDGTVADSFFVPSPGGAVETADGSVYVANRDGGVATKEGATGYRNIVPNGPAAATSYDIKAKAGRVLIAHGGYSDGFVQLGLDAGMSILSPDDGRWTIYNRFTYGPFSPGARDITAIVEGADGTLYAGSLRDGLQIIHPDGRFERFREGSPIENAYNTGSDSVYNVISLAIDRNDNLVVGQFAAIAHELVVRTPAGQWYRYTTPQSTATPFFNTAVDVTIDEANQRWWFSPGGGVFVYNDGGTPETPGDDGSRRFMAGNGVGGLPSNAALSLALDRDGAIWVGTIDGIGIISCASTAISDPTNCEAERPIVQYDQFAGFLFEGESVRTIAVDGANRKWIGTTNGVWLISPNGDSVVERFTVENSPLPSNVIQKIAVDGVTGDVYIGTDAGLLSYRGTSTDGGETNDEIIAFPNPVPSGYRGTIAVRGLTENADVRITDIAGQLVYRTKALGGQAVWNGMDYTGRRPQSGVYMVFATNSDGTQAGTGKIVFME